MAQDSSLYVIDVYVPNEGEPESALELTILRLPSTTQRPEVYVHTYIKPVAYSIDNILWKKAASQGIKREMVCSNFWPSLRDVIKADYLKDRYAMCFGTSWEPYQSFVQNCTEKWSILSLWQEVFSGDDEVGAFTSYEDMLEYMGLPRRDPSNTRYTASMKRAHAILAIWLYLYNCKRYRIKPEAKETVGDGSYKNYWPLNSVPDPWYSPDAHDLIDIPSEALCDYFSDRLPDYVDWSNLCIYRHDWIFGRDRRTDVKLSEQDAMINFIFYRIFDLKSRILVLTFYALYYKSTDYARIVALHQSDLSTLPQAVKEVFFSFIISHLDDFLSATQKKQIITALVKQLFLSRFEQPLELYDFEEIRKHSADNGFTCEEETVPSNRNIPCYREIRNGDKVLYRCFIIMGSTTERNECVQIVNDRITALLREVRNPFAPCWLSEDLKQWICYITGFSWNELSGVPRPNDSVSLTRTRQTIREIIGEQSLVYQRQYYANFKSIAKQFDKMPEDQKTSSQFSFQGITHEVMVDKTTDSMGFFARLKHMFS